MIKGVIFDFDNTIYDYDKINQDALNNILNPDDIILYNNISSEIKKSNNCNNKFNKSIYFKRFVETKKLPFIEIYNLIDKYNSYFNTHIKLNDNIVDLFILLKKHNIKIIILSNNTIENQLERIRILKIEKYVDFLITTDEVGEEKPNDITFIYVSHKCNIPFSNLIMIGDNNETDIIPCKKLGLYAIKYNNNFQEIYTFFNNYFSNLTDFVFLSKFFGQGIENIQGKGGNISIKFNDYLIIKSSGCIHGNINIYNGISVLKNGIKIFGLIPSMEYHFHLDMKKYTVHLHYTPINKYLFTTEHMDLSNFKLNYTTIDYFEPGIQLSKKIKEKYINHEIIFLKNHGIILTADTLDEILVNYKYIHTFFTVDSYEKYDICKYLYDNLRLCKVIREYHHYIDNIVCCSPDIAVFCKNFKKINHLIEIEDNLDIISYNNKTYLIANDIINIYALIEILDEYLKITKTMVNINNIDELLNTEQEIYRKNL